MALNLYFELQSFIILTLTKVMLDSGILTRRLIKEGLDQSSGFLSSPPRTKSMTSHLCQ